VRHGGLRARPHRPPLDPRRRRRGVEAVLRDDRGRERNGRRVPRGGDGGRYADNGVPGERVYHPGDYGAFVLDPDGSNVEVVCHNR
jgi:hypothetical protein